MGLRGWIAAGSLAIGVGSTGVARADELDPALSRLLVNGDCRANLGAIVDDLLVRATVRDGYLEQGLSGRDGLCAPDNAAFKKLVSQLGFALAPNGMYPARSTGFGGFHFSFQASYTAIDESADDWQMGTQGERDSSSRGAAAVGDPPGLIQQYSLNIRKNFLLGIEALANVGFVRQSNRINGGADIRVRLLEGFRTGIGDAFPDVAVGAGIRTTTGTDQLQLTTVAVDARISKPADRKSIGIEPLAGVPISMDIRTLRADRLDPGTDPLGYCESPGPTSPAKEIIWSTRTTTDNRSVLGVHPRLQQQRCVRRRQPRAPEIGFRHQLSVRVVERRRSVGHRPV